jgi:beta-glucosidase
MPDSTPQAPALNSAPQDSGWWTRREFLATGSSALALAALPGAALSGDDAGQAEAPASSSASSSAPSKSGFPAGFLWGASTSAYQIEGAAREDDKGPSVWDEFVRRPGAIADGQTGDTACDFYHRYAQDVAGMKAMGLRAFRFSVSWPRVIPEGTGAPNQKGLDFYQRVVDALLAAGIAPVLTLFHWDTPLALARRGGWGSRDMTGWFADYAALLARTLGDRVPYWLTINEPRSFIGGGYVTGVQAPGATLSRSEYLRAAHITLLAHGGAVQAVRANSARTVQIGCPCDVSPALPAGRSAADADAARNATFASPLGHFFGDLWWRENAWWLDPIYRGEYPADALAALGDDAPEIGVGDMAAIRQPLDFLAANIYGGRLVRAAASGQSQDAALPPGFPITSSYSWPVTPEALYWGPKWLHERYRLPVFLTENGCSCPNWASLDGQVHDPQRIDFTRRYLQALARAGREGVRLRGYLHWSLLDNFEWQEGYTRRWGMIFVDFPTQKRIAKDSARWYAGVIQSNGASGL